MFREQRGVLVVFLFICLAQIVLADASITVNSPQPITYNNATILLNITSDGNSTWYNYNGTNTTYTAEAEITFNEGNNTLYVWANDTDNNITETSVNFTVDTIAPNITINSPTNKTYDTTNILFNLTLDENGTCYFTTDYGDTNISLDTADNLNFNYTNSSMSEGNYTAIFYCNDSIGNLRIKNITFKVDTTYPEIVFNDDTTNITLSNVSEIVINVTANDTNLNYTEINIYNSTYDIINTTIGTYVNYTILLDGIYYFNATTYDLAGHTNSTETRNITIDTLLPSIIINSPINITYNSTEITINITSDGNTTWFFNGTDNETYTNLLYRNYTDGQYTLHIWSNDSAGNLNYTNITFTIDTIYPEIYFNNDTDNTSLIGRDNIIINVTTNDTNINYTEINIYNETLNLVNTTLGTYVNFTVPIDGMYYFNATTYDLAGHTNNTETRNITIDTLLPNLTFTAPSDNGNRNRQYIVINVTANKQSISNITINLYNSSSDLINSTTFTNYTAFINITNLTDDTYYYNATAYDTLDRIGHSITESVNINTNFPTISIVNPADTSSLLNRNYIVINTSTTGANITNVTIELFNSTGYLINSTNDNESGITYNFSNLVEGTYFFNATVINLMNYTDTTETYNITIDLTNPSITIESDSDNGTIIGTSQIFVNVSATDTYLSNITIDIYDGNNSLIYNITTTNNNITLSYNLTNDGTYYYNATAYDLAGNYNYSETRTIITDTTSPNITFNYPTSSNVTINISSITINITVNDTNFLNSTIYLYSFNGTLLNETLSNNSESAVTLTNLSDGIYYYNATAYDSFGNYNITDTKNITINTTIPVITPPVVVSSGGGGGGGSGGGAIIGSNTTDTNNTSGATFTQYWPSIINGSRTINVDRTGMPLLQVIVTTNNNSNVANTLTIIAQSYNPYRNSINATIYSFIVIDTNLDNKYVNNVSFRFKVQKKWLTQNNLTSDNVTLYNYNNNSWNTVEASKYSEDTGYVYYVSSSPVLSNMAIGGPLIPVTESIKQEINTEVETDLNTNENITTNTVDLTISQKGFFGKTRDSIANAATRIYDKIMASKEAKSLIVISIAAILILIIGAVSGVLIYKNSIKPRRMRRMYNKNIMPGSIMPYREEPPLQQQAKIEVPLQVKTDKMPPEVVVAPDSEFNVRKISELLMQCEFALNNNKIVDAKTYYEQAKSLYFNSNLDYEHKAKVYDKIITLHGKLGNK